MYAAVPVPLQLTLHRELNSHCAARRSKGQSSAQIFPLGTGDWREMVVTAQIIRLDTPARVSSRSRAQQLFETVPADLSARHLIVDLAGHESAPPSFLDEVVRIALSDRCAAQVDFVNVAPRLAAYIEQSARRRGVDNRCIIDRRG